MGIRLPGERFSGEGFGFDSAPHPWQGSRPFSPELEEAAALANPELGAKQICPTCSSKFYDLNRRPAHCPKCDTEFDPEEALRSRRVRTRAPLPEEEIEEVKVVPAEAEEDEGFEAEVEEAPELDEGVEAEPIEASDDEEGDSETPAAPDEALGVDFAEDEDDLEEAEDEVPFIEDDEDEFSEDEIDGLPEEGDSDE
jgi:uncharacterized protein (TIGR02300 family)